MSCKAVGFDAFFDELKEIAGDTKEICGRCIFEGGRVMADGLKAKIDSIPAWQNEPGHRARGVTDVERAGLKEGLGIAKMRTNGDEFDISIGFDGYNGDVTPKYPGGHPNSMIARTVESGTSWFAKTPFISQTGRANKGAAEAAMQQAFDEEIAKRTT